MTAHFHKITLFLTLFSELEIIFCSVCEFSQLSFNSSALKAIFSTDCTGETKKKKKLLEKKIVLFISNDDGDGKSEHIHVVICPKMLY